VTIHPNVHELRRLAAVREQEFLTQPMSLGLRLGEPAVASPETRDLPWWRPVPPVPEQPQYIEPRRTVRQFLADELPGALAVVGTVGATAWAIAAYLVGAA
jgi:hypothetical protein